MMNNRKIAITICGDIACCGAVESYYLSNHSIPINKELLSIIHKTDIFIGNLECPLTDHSTPQWSHFKTLKASLKSGEILKELKLNAVSLANNHIADYGEIGLRDTIEFLQSSRIHWGGAGFTKEQAEKPIILEKNGYRIGILNLAQKEIASISGLGWGAAVLEADSAVQQMRRLVSTTEIAIAYLHMGVEFFNYPTPNQVRLCRALINEGAKMVVCHHPHVPQGYETYNDGFIGYGLGNFLFDMKPIKNSSSRIGIVLRISFDDLKIGKLEILPVETANGYTTVLPIHKALEAEKFLKQLCAPLLDHRLLLMHHYFTCRDNLFIHLKAFIKYGLVKGNFKKIQDLINQQRWPQISEMRKHLIRYLLSGNALRSEYEKSSYPQSISSLAWRCFCIFSSLLGKIVSRTNFLSQK